MLCGLAHDARNLAAQSQSNQLLVDTRTSRAAEAACSRALTTECSKSLNEMARETNRAKLELVTRNRSLGSITIIILVPHI